MEVDPETPPTRSKKNNPFYKSFKPVANTIFFPYFQNFMYQDFEFLVKTNENLMVIKKDENQFLYYNLAEFLLRLNTKFNQFIGYHEDIALLFKPYIEELLRKGKLSCEFRVTENKLGVFISTICYGKRNIEVFLDVSSHFYIICESEIDYFGFSTLFLQNTPNENFLKSDTNNDYLESFKAIICNFVE